MRPKGDQMQRLLVGTLMGTVLVLSIGSAAAVDVPVPTKLYLSKASPLLTKIVAKPTGPIILPTPNGPDDPRDFGAIVMPGCGPGLIGPIFWENGDVFLPPPIWKALGNPAGSKGYKYRGQGTMADPCKVVLIKSTVVKAVCRIVDSALPRPVGGNIGWEIRVGGGYRLCGETTGGTIAKDDTSAFKARNAPAPGVCADINSPSGAFVDRTMDLF